MWCYDVFRSELHALPPHPYALLPHISPRPHRSAAHTSHSTPRTAMWPRTSSILCSPGITGAKPATSKTSTTLTSSPTWTSLHLKLEMITIAKLVPVNLTVTLMLTLVVTRASPSAALCQDSSPPPLAVILREAESPSILVMTAASVTTGHGLRSQLPIIQTPNISGLLAFLVIM